MMFPLLVEKADLDELAVEIGPNGKYLAKDGLSWVALNKNDDKPFIETVQAFETFELALKWLQK
ncbi:hypothetical protein MKY29_12165 [Psychrobacillus sp. FSL K6-2365]|uniref:hypothetical protein n=1 Tax=Psychrobacillus sp. FSL K6-2365 TaxID=2921546 RepID=UPI0030FC8044